MSTLARILLFSSTLFCTNVFACSCIGERTVKEEIKHSDAVVNGTIISKNLVTLFDSTSAALYGKANNDHLNRSLYETTVAKYEFVITSRYKGRFKSDTIEVYTGLGNGDCGIRFEVGKTYLIYGMMKTYFGQLNNDTPFPTGKNIIWTDTCSRTTSRTEEIAEIEKYKRRK